MSAVPCVASVGQCIVFEIDSCCMCPQSFLVWGLVWGDHLTFQIRLSIDLALRVGDPWVGFCLSFGYLPSLF